MAYKSNSITTVTSSQNPMVTRRSVTFSARVRSSLIDAGEPTGMVSFYAGEICVAVVPLVQGVATCTLGSLAPRLHTVSVTYPGDSNFHGSRGALPGGQVVKPAGYWLASRDGAVFPFGDLGYHGSLSGSTDGAPVVAISSCAEGAGYWLVDQAGAVSAFGEAPALGSVDRPTAPAVSLAAARRLKGYWVACADGTVHPFGDAEVQPPSGPDPATAAATVSIASTPTGQGYWLAGADGSVQAFGDAGFHGAAATGIVGMAATITGQGYWLAGADGGVCSFGDAEFLGSAGDMPLDAPVVGMAASPDGLGYWLASADGGIFGYGDVIFDGSLPARGLRRNGVVALAGP